MNARSRLIVAGAFALAAAAAYWMYAAWPMWRGVEITLAVVARAQGDGAIALEFSGERLDAGFSDAPRPVAEGQFVKARAIGNLWNPAVDVAANARRLGGRTVFVQFRPARSTETGRPVMWQPVSVSDAAIAGEVNLRAVVRNVDPAGRLTLQFGVRTIRGPMAGRRGGEPLAATHAVLSVLPSGRHVVVRLLADGRPFRG
jgi:hypothetical protein